MSGALKQQVGTYKLRTPGRTGGQYNVAPAVALGQIMLTQAEIDSPGGWHVVKLVETYNPCQRIAYPVRGGEYHGGEVAAFPEAEAAAMIAAGIAQEV